MSGIFILFAAVISIGAVLVFGIVIIGFIRHGQIFNRISDHVEAGLAQADSEKRAEKLVPCSYCHSPIPAGTRCTSCGAGA
jgi:hypothetical protein